MNETLDRITPFFPWLGLVLILGGGVAYFISSQFGLATNLLLGGGALLLLLFVALRPDEIRQLASGRQTRYGGNTILSILFFVAIAILLYYVAFQNSDWRYDATETSEFTPLPETQQLLEQVDEPIHVLGFYTALNANQRQQARERLESLQAFSNGNLTFEFVDPEANPLLAEEYEVSVDGTLVFVKGEGEDAVTATASTLTDRSIHTALLRTANPVEKNLYFVTGHGERDISDFSPTGIARALTLLEDNGFTVQTLNLFVEGAVPEDASAAVIIDQQSPMAPEEIEALRTYLDNGGALFVARDAVDSSRAPAEEDGLNQLLTENWGVTLHNDVIVEQVLAQAGQGFGLTFVGADYGSSPIISSDMSQFGTVFEVARSVATQSVEGVTQTPLITTSDQSWGETNIQALVNQGSAEPDEADHSGPLNVGVSAENQENNGRIVVFGDTDFVANGLISRGGNGLLLTNAMNWLAGDEVAPDLTPREEVSRQVVISQSELGWLQLVSVCLGPGIMLLIGLAVWYSRRQVI